MSQQPTFKIGAFAMIFDEQERILFAHRTDMDIWNLPGGGVEVGETPWEAVVREVQEETGLEVVVQKLTGVYVKKSDSVVVFHFLCQQVGGTLTKNAEARAFQFFALDDLPINTSPAQKDRIRHYLDDPDTLQLKENIEMSSRELLEQLGK